MSTATFGELAQVASERLRVAVTRLPASGLEPGEVAGSLVCAGQVVRALTRYLDDVVGTDDLEVLLGQDGGGGRQAAAHAREALAMAASSLGWAADALAAAGPQGQAGELGAAGAAVAAELIGTAAALTAGRDLLGTHVSADELSGPAASSWPAVITSAEVSGALADQAGQWSGQLATWVHGLLVATTADPRFPGTTRQDLASAHQWLQAASTAAVAAREPGQLAAGQLLLRAIPANIVPDARPLIGPEPDPALRDGIAVSAARLRAVAYAPGQGGGWAPELTAESWRWAANATAVISDISEVLLSALAERAGTAAGAQHLLADAAQAAATTCDRWRDVMAAWGRLHTETQGITAPGIADTSDLIIRIGRLTFADPQWAPARSRHTPPRDPASLAPDKEQAAAILAALHDAADALAAKSVADLRDVQAAVGARRLYAPTSTLPEYYDIPRPYGPAMPASTDNLVGAYQVAVTASQKLAIALDAVAVQVGAPSQVLALARAAISRATEARAHHGEDGQHEDTLTIPIPGKISTKTIPGPVERQVRATGTADPMLLLRAKAIDTAISKATQELVTQAREGLRQADAPDAEDVVARPVSAASSASAVASQSFPQRLAVSGGRTSAADAGHATPRHARLQAADTSAVRRDRPAPR